MEKQEFISLVKDGAIEGMKQYGVLASLTIAQAILESGWGESGLAKDGYNLFGIKAFDYPEKIKYPTSEWDGTQYVIIDADFRLYNDWNESILDHAKFLVDNERYSNLIGVTDYKEACRLIMEDEYATEPSYDNLLIELIEENGLDQYDVLESEFVPQYIELEVTADIPALKDTTSIIKNFKAGDKITAITTPEDITGYWKLNIDGVDAYIPVENCKYREA